MSTEQPLDVRGFWLSIRRHRTAVLLAVVVGAVLLAAVPVVHPPSWSSTSQVLLPPPPTNDGQQTDRDPETYVAVATSGSVLGPVAKAMRPGTTVRALQQRLSVTATSTDVLTIAASGTTAAGAERLARAVSAALVRYLAETSSTLSNAQQQALDQRLGSLTASLDDVDQQLTAAKRRAQQQAPTSADGRATANAIAQLTAQQARLVQSVDEVRKEKAAGLTPAAGSVTDQARVIQEASAADRLPVVVWMAGFALLGGLLGLGGAAAVVALVRRSRRRLWSRDGLADAIGSPVLASVASRTPRSVGGWTTLLSTYEPGPVDAWSWRQLLRDHVLPAGDPDQLRLAGRQVPQRHLLVVAFADDPAAVATAAQAASYAASTGVRTRFVAGQGRDAAARLWAAVGRGADLRDGLRADTAPFRDTDDDLVVLLALVERRDPVLELRGRADCVLVAVSPGTSTGEELARLAVALDDAGCTVDGLLVADADTADRTTGRTGAPAPARRGGARRAAPLQHEAAPGTLALAGPAAYDEGPTPVMAPVISVAGRRRKVK